MADSVGGRNVLDSGSANITIEPTERGPLVLVIEHTSGADDGKWFGLEMTPEAARRIALGLVSAAGMMP